MKIEKNNFFINHFLLSKYTYNTLASYPLLINFNFNVVLYYKQKHKFFLFINLLFLLLFFNPNLKTRFFFKTSPINILQINLRSSHSILQFIYNFIYIYFPLIDSFSTELKLLTKHNNVKFCFFKFPLLLELNLLFFSLEYLYIFLNTYKFQLEFIFKKQKNNLVNYNLLQLLKLPILLK